MKKIRAVGVLFEDADGKILVLRRHPNSREGSTWGLVGGNIDYGENSAQAALRETHEEINHVINIKDLIFEKSYTWNNYDSIIKFDVFRYKTSQEKVIIKLDTEENVEYLWVKPIELYQRKDLMKGLYSILKDLYEL
jgi:8-oxo-dGTP diphosphatase